jgi:hypothetical protein
VRGHDSVVELKRGPAEEEALVLLFGHLLPLMRRTVDGLFENVEVAELVLWRLRGRWNVGTAKTGDAGQSISL